jgi:hypothetical protein
MKLKLIEFGKTNAQGRKRYKKKLKAKSPKTPKGILATKEDRDKVKTSIQVVQEGRKWINTGTNLARMFR